MFDPARSFNLIDKEDIYIMFDSKTEKKYIHSDENYKIAKLLMNQGKQNY